MVNFIFFFCAFLYFLSFLQIAHNSFVIRKTIAMKRKQLWLLFKVFLLWLEERSLMLAPHLQKTAGLLGEADGSEPVRKKWRRRFKANAPLWQNHTFLCSCFRWVWGIQQRQLLPHTATSLEAGFLSPIDSQVNLFLSRWHILKWDQLLSGRSGDSRKCYKFMKDHWPREQTYCSHK